ncbi:MAG TPA: aldose 1-epimerase [Ramlibacter sp.]
MIELRAGRLRCELHPELGGSIAGLWLDGQPVLRSTPAGQLASARFAGCYPVVPFSNRVGQASVVWRGTQEPQFRQAGDAPHAIHGMAWQRAWSVLDSDDASAMLACEHRSDAAWPFAFDCSHTLRLSPRGLELTLAVTNQSGQLAPMGLGWHPSFPKRPGSRLAVSAGGRWELDGDRLPLARRPAEGIAADAAALDLDECFDGWDGQAQLRDTVMRVTVQSELARLVVHAEPGSEAIMLAPVSHVPNAVHVYATGAPAAGLGLSLLQPGESLLAQMRILVEPAS